MAEENAQEARVHALAAHDRTDEENRTAAAAVLLAPLVRKQEQAARKLNAKAETETESRCRNAKDRWWQPVCSRTGAGSAACTGCPRPLTGGRRRRRTNADCTARCHAATGTGRSARDAAQYRGSCAPTMTVPDLAGTRQIPHDECLRRFLQPHSTLPRWPRR